MDAAQLALVLAVGALFVGPLLLWLSDGASRLRAGLDGLVLALVGGICLLHLGPHALSHGGLAALAGIGIGLGLPALLRRRDKSIWWMGSGLALLGLHAMFDGAALTIMDASLTSGVGAAIVAHRLPVGLAIAHRAGHASRAAAVLGSLAGLTVLGFAFGSRAGAWFGPGVEGLLEGFIVGGLLHVVMGHRSSAPEAAGERASMATLKIVSFAPAQQAPLAPGIGAPACAHVGCTHGHGTSEGHHAHDHGPAEDRRASAVGALLGVAALTLLAAFAGDSHALSHLRATASAFVALSLTSAPALLAGFVLAGLVSALLDPARASWLGGGRRGSQALRGVLFGLPLPVCSCGVVPMYRSLIQRGVPVTAGLAFLVATPELGLDAVLLSVPLLGLPLTVARVVAAFAVAVAVALLVGHGSPPSTLPAKEEVAGVAPSLVDRLRDGLRYGLVDLVDHTLPWIVVGLLLASLAEPLMDHDLLASLPSVLQVPLAAVIGVPMYVCASGATPLAAVAVHKGLSAGAAMTFLLAGPATNVTTFGVLAALHGRRLAIRFGVALTVIAVLCGWGVDLLDLPMPEMAHPGHAHDDGVALIPLLSALALLALGAGSLWRQGARGVVEQVANPVHVH